MWYTTFTECNSDRRDDQGRWVDCGSGKRWYGMVRQHQLLPLHRGR